MAFLYPTKLDTPTMRSWEVYYAVWLTIFCFGVIINNEHMLIMFKGV